jgi:hypothetical protein
MTPTPEELARWFHEAYEELAPLHGYKTRRDSAVPWERVPETNRTLMIATSKRVLARIAAASVPPNESPERAFRRLKRIFDFGSRAARERDALHFQLGAMAIRLEPEAVEDYIRTLPWKVSSHEEITAVAGNIRAFAAHLRRHLTPGDHQ